MALSDATEQAELVRRGEASPVELVDAAIERIEALNPQINAVIHSRFEAARAEAAQLDVAASGPFAGVPFLVKDLGAAIAGEPHHMGSEALKQVDFRSPVHSTLYERFQKLGFVTLGRTNTPEFGLTVTTEPVSQGPTRNPWNLDHSTGGSSGGSAAAVAGGLVAVAHANDGGGSIRVPASECGLVGLKPTRGRVSQAPYLGEGWAGSTADGVVSHSVRDTAAVLDGISGPEPGDPYIAPAPARPFVEEVGAPVGTLKIGIAPTVPHATMHPETVKAVENAGQLLEQLGHRVEIAQPAAFSEAEYFARFSTLVAVNLAAELSELGDLLGSPLGPGGLEEGTWRFAQLGQAVTAAEYITTVHWLHAWHRRMASWWHDDGFDVLVTATLAVPPPRIGWLSDPEHGMRRLQEVLVTTSQFNVTGQPAISLPLHHTADGLPVGVQFVGPYGDEALLLRLASQLEGACPWADRVPPLAAQ